MATATKRSKNDVKRVLRELRNAELLSLLAAHGCKPLVKQLIKLGANVSAKCWEKVIKHRQLAVFALFLKKGNSIIFFFNILKIDTLINIKAAKNGTIKAILEHTA